MLIPTKKVLKRVIAISLAGTRGGPVRLSIINMLSKRQMNMNELARELSLDYKTVQHHIRVLEKSGLIVSAGRKYGNAYSISPLLAAHKDVLAEIWSDMGKSK